MRLRKNKKPKETLINGFIDLTRVDSIGSLPSLRLIINCEATIVVTFFLKLNLCSINSLVLPTVLWLERKLER